MNIVFGNDLNVLAEELLSELFSSRSGPFTNRILVVPSSSLKSFLLQRCFPALKIAAGMQILPLNQAVLEILDSEPGGHPRKKIPSFLELSLSIEERLHSTWIEQFPSLLHYLGSDPIVRKQKCASLSDELARLFTRYGLYGEQFLIRWSTSSEWQAALWRTIFSVDSPWTYPLEVFKNLQVNFKGKIALFGFSHLSSAHLHFFSALSASLYQLSPCSLFWEDQLSDKQRLSMLRVAKQEDRHYLLQTNHPLLGNWGKLGKQMLKSLDGFAVGEREVYREQEATRLLSRVQQTLLDMEERPALVEDDSLQLHSATSRLREIEILRDALETLMHTHVERGDPISPSEVLVAAPDIAAYAPYIHMVFSSSRFSYSIDGLPLSTMSEAVQGFLQLIRLPQEEFSLSSMIKLLRCDALRTNWKEEIADLQEWFHHAQIRGQLRDHPHSWETGLDRLLHGLALIPDPDSKLETWPIACIPQSEIDTFNHFLEFFTEIKDDLASLAQEKSAEKWLAWLLEIAEKYFAIEWENEPFFQELRGLAMTYRSSTQILLDFESIERVLTHLAQKPSGEMTSAQMVHIRFTSLQLGHFGAARILWCLGMDEEAFPRTDLRSSLCEMSRLGTSDYFPLKADEDRALFLELLLKSSDYLIFSYQRLHPRDGKMQAPSLLIEEFQQYLRVCGLPNGMRQWDHPAFPYDAQYFSPEASIKKWSEIDYLAARAYYSPQPKIAPFLVKQATPITDNKISIDIRQLKKLAKNPLQFYFQETLKIFLQEPEDEEQGDFLLSHLHKAKLRKQALRMDLPQILQSHKAKGKLPLGLFQQTAVQELQADWEELLQELHKLQVSPEEMYSVQFSSACSEQDKTEKLLPPLSIPLNSSQTVYITGILEDVSPKGLLFHGEDSLASLVKVWPLYLIDRCIHSEPRPLLLTKEGVALEFDLDDPKAALADYLHYTLLAKQIPSPLMPQWAKALLEGNLADWNTALSKGLNYDDLYFNYLERRQAVFDAEVTFDFWAPKLRQYLSRLRRR